MIIALKAYQPFDYVKSICDYGRNAWDTPAQNCMGLCEKIAKISLAILLALPALVLDLAMSATALIYRVCCCPTESKNPTSVVQSISQKEALSQDLIDRVLANPYPGYRGRRIDHVEFFKGSITAALSFHENNQNLYLEALRDSCDIEDEDYAIPSSLWATGCLVAHSLRAYPNAYPNLRSVLPAFREHEIAIDELQQDFLQLSNIEQATVLLKIMVPKRKWELSDHAKNVLHLIQDKVLRMTQDEGFLKHCLTPVVKWSKSP